MNGESVQLDCGRILEIRRFISWPASRDQTWQPPFRVNLASVPPCARSVALKFAPGPQARLSANGPTRKPKDWLAPGHPARPDGTPLHSPSLPLHSGSQVSSRRRIKWCDQSGVEFSAKRAANSTPFSSQMGWRTTDTFIDAMTSPA